ncbi:MAG: hypothetical protein ABWJ42_05410 [Sulfolobales archaeon]
MSLVMAQIDSGMILLILLVIMLIAMILPSLLRGEESEKKTQKPKVYTEISCVKNDYSESREFVPGDYVGKILEDRKCPKCGSPLYIKGIYAVYPETREARRD